MGKDKFLVEPDEVPNERDDQPQDHLIAHEANRVKIELTFKNITVTAKPKKRRCRRPKPGASQSQPQEKIILDNISGSVKPGEFLAIIGASGAGKTTLLNYLSDKDISRNLKKTGTIEVNGVNRKSIKFSKYCAYVQQHDVLFQSLTVKECLTFAAKLKLPPRENYGEVVEEILEDLKLKKSEDVKIGGSLVKGISGGER